MNWWSADAFVTIWSWIGGGPPVVALIVVGLTVRRLVGPIRRHIRAKRHDRESPRRAAIRNTLTERRADEAPGAKDARRVIVHVLDTGATVTELLTTCRRGAQLSPDNADRAAEFSSIGDLIENIGERLVAAAVRQPPLTGSRSSASRVEAA